MFLTSSLSLITLFTTGAFAASSASLFAPTFPVVAYPVATANGATTYLVACTAGSDTSTCNFVQPYTLIQGQNTVEFALTAGTQAATLGCAIQGTTYLACSATGGSGGSIVTAFTTFTGDSVATHFRDIALQTASSDLLTYPTPSSTSAPSSSSANSSPSSTPSSQSSTITSSASYSASVNITSSIFELVAPTEAATTSSSSSLTSAEASSTGLGVALGPGTTTSAVVSSTSSATQTKASASGLGNAGSRSVSCGLGWVVGGMLVVVGGVMI